MARFEALLAPASNASDWRAVIDQLAQEWQGAADWLDGRNASLTVHVAPTGLQVKLLLELQPSGQLGVLVSSREGMGGGAVQTKEVLDQLLASLERLLPGVQVVFRSDRDGPIRQRA
jgi:hypothetical protein